MKYNKCDEIFYMRRDWFINKGHVVTVTVTVNQTFCVGWRNISSFYDYALFTSNLYIPEHIVSPFVFLKYVICNCWKLSSDSHLFSDFELEHCLELFRYFARAHGSITTLDWFSILKLITWTVDTDWFCYPTFHAEYELNFLLYRIFSPNMTFKWPVSQISW